ncbi:TrmH family RNA methyltransferase [Allofustis seminis]|uniref:TrmH family RNA methyltransferase n=1 Tax=Allofustis seminis TaxID=166939 RepID=UPI0003603109|nr:TrmH family RNA methyltransferase [Allofustis seminis]
MTSYIAYKKELPHTYILGAFPTIEALEEVPELFLHVFIDPDYYEAPSLIERLRQHAIPYDISARSIRRLAHKENTRVVGVLKKALPPVQDISHVVLENVSNMGNLGTIIRTMVGMGIYHLVTVGTICDIYHPKTIRASMGAFFKIHHTHFNSMADYHATYSTCRHKYFFLLNASALPLPKVHTIHPSDEHYSLIFGNEGSGLEQDYAPLGTSVFIPQTADIDSLNLPISVAMALYEFQCH